MSLRWSIKSLSLFLLDIFFTFQMFSPFPVSLPPGNILSHPPSPCLYEGVPPLTHPLPPPCPRFPYTGAGPLFPLMPDKAILCYIYSWSHVNSFVDGFVLGSYWGVWLVDIVVLPMELQTPSAPSVLSLTPPLGTLCSVQWLAESIHFCICQALAEPLRRQLYQAPVSMHFLASTIVSGFSNCIWDESLGGTVSGWPFL